MFRQIRSSMIIGIAVCVLMGDDRPAVAAPVREVPQGERYINNTEVTVHSMKKYLYKYNVVQNTRHSPESDKFAYCFWTPVYGDYSVIRCTGADDDHSGMVGPGDTADVKFYVEALPEEAEVVCAKWYSDTVWTVYEGRATPAPSPRAAATLLRGDEFTVKVVLKNEAREWVGEDPDPGEPGDYSGTVYGSEIYYAEWQEKLHEENMTEVLWTCVDISSNPPDPDAPDPVSWTECLNDAKCEEVPDAYEYCGRCEEGHGITWLHPEPWPATFGLTPGTDTYPHFELPVTYKGSKRILFRHYKDDTDDAYVYGTSDYEVMQFRVRDVIPTVGEWGLVVMGVLLLTGGTIVYMRRRAVAARA